MRATTPTTATHASRPGTSGPIRSRSPSHSSSAATRSSTSAPETRPLGPSAVWPVIRGAAVTCNEAPATARSGEVPLAVRIICVGAGPPWPIQPWRRLTGGGALHAPHCGSSSTTSSSGAAPAGDVPLATEDGGADQAHRAADEQERREDRSRRRALVLGGRRRRTRRAGLSFVVGRPGPVRVG